jgi:uncharacterized RDD family membrane protein YckC
MIAGGPALVPREVRAYQGRRAGVVSRSLAAAVDLLVVIAVLVGSWAAWAGLVFLLNPAGFRFPTGSVLLGVGAGLAVLVVYLTGAWITTGRTYGNRLMGLRVVNFHGTRLRLPAALLRAVAYAGFPVGLLWVAVSRQNRSLQDVVLRTSVIYDWTQRPPQPSSSDDRPPAAGMS